MPAWAGISVGRLIPLGILGQPLQADRRRIRHLRLGVSRQQMQCLFCGIGIPRHFEANIRIAVLRQDSQGIGRHIFETGHDAADAAILVSGQALEGRLGC